MSGTRSLHLYTFMAYIISDFWALIDREIGSYIFQGTYAFVLCVIPNLQFCMLVRENDRLMY
jgi:hypothetical protein